MVCVSVAMGGAPRPSEISGAGLPPAAWVSPKKFGEHPSVPKSPCVFFRNFLKLSEAPRGPSSTECYTQKQASPEFRKPVGAHVCGDPHGCVTWHWSCEPCTRVSFQRTGASVNPACGEPGKALAGND